MINKIKEKGRSRRYWKTRISMASLSRKKGYAIDTISWKTCLVSLWVPDHATQVPGCPALPGYLVNALVHNFSFDSLSKYRQDPPITCSANNLGGPLPSFFKWWPSTDFVFLGPWKVPTFFYPLSLLSQRGIVSSCPCVRTSAVCPGSSFFNALVYRHETSHMHAQEKTC